MKYDIYHCAPGATLRAVEYLRETGVRAWVPITIIRRRLPRSKRRVTEQRAAIPGFVFIPQLDAKPSAIDRPLWAALRPLWTPTGAQAACTQEELLQMQEVLNDAFGATRETVGSFPPEVSTISAGSLVRIDAGPFKGFSGLLTDWDEEGTATVDLRGSLGVLKISPCLLKPF